MLDQTKINQLPSLTIHAYSFFSELAQELEKQKLKSVRGMPKANCDGCYVYPVKRDIVKFAFYAHGFSDQITAVDIDMRECQKDPKTYIEYILEDVNSIHKEAKDSHTEIYAPPQKTKIAKAMVN